MLFAATERAVFVYSPWGWKQIWISAADIKLQAIGVIRGANQEVLLVGTDEALWEISWQRGADRRSPWSVFHYEFPSRAIERKSSSGIRAIYRNDDKSLARGYALDDSGQLIPIQVTTDIKLGVPIHIPGAQPSVIWSSGPNGWSFAWGYTASTLLTLNPSGLEASRVDLADAQSVGPGSIAHRPRIHVGASSHQATRHHVRVNSQQSLPTESLARFGKDLMI